MSAFPGFEGAPRASRVPWKWNNHDTTIRRFFFDCFEPRQEHIEEKAGRHIDDFLVTGREPNLKRFLAQARDKLDMHDAVRLCKAGDEGRLLAMNICKLENGYSLQGKPLLIHGIAAALEMETAKSSLIPETINEKAQDGGDQMKHEPSKHGLAMHCTSGIIVQVFSTA